MHQNCYGEEVRIVQYLSYLARDLMTESQALKRQANFLNQRTTTHWAYPQRVTSIHQNDFGSTSKFKREKALERAGKKGVLAEGEGSDEIFALL